MFSDEFQDSERDFSSWCDSKWHALDLNYYVNGTALIEALAVVPVSCSITVARLRPQLQPIQALQLQQHFYLIFRVNCMYC